MKKTRLLAIALIGLALVGCTTRDPVTGTTATAPYTADIRWTSHGIPHIRAFDWRGAGYGLAYAVATDAVCVLAEEFVTVRGERSRYFGSGGTGVAGEQPNVDSDAFYQALLNESKVERFLAAGSEKANALIEGYVAGYNRFLQDQSSNLPVECEGLPWVLPIDQRDVARLSIGVGIRYGLGRVISAIANASPGTATEVALTTADGSNALAFGRALTENGRGMLLGNPHYPWHGPSRFHLAHMTIPGEIDVMGAGLITSPLVNIGFNRDVAWTHTVSSALRFTLFRLDLDPDSPMRYRSDGRFRDITEKTIRLDVRQVDGSYTRELRTVYTTHLGPIVATPDTPWGPDHVYVMRDVNYENDRSADQYIDLGRASSVAEIRKVLARHQGVSFVNTIAADRSGSAFYGDVSAIPFVTASQIERCRVGPERVGGRRIIALDGSRSDCNWQQSDEAAAPGLMPPSQMPALITDTWVNNANDSHWLSNPVQRLEGFSPVIGDERTPRSLRTRAGLVFVQELLDSKGSVNTRDIQDLLFSHRHFGAELLLDDILTVCRNTNTTLDIAAACSILAEWDRRQDVDSRGAHIYNELWTAIGREIGAHFSVPFDLTDPVNTPRGLTIDREDTQQLIMNGLETALAEIDAAGILPMARWGDVQFATRGGEKIGIPGGNGYAGMYSVITARLNKQAGGYTPIRHGNSYVQIVTWQDDGTPDARAILTYSQSPQRDSRWYADQTRLYSRSAWIRLPFTQREIDADMIQRLQLTEIQ